MWLPTIAVLFLIQMIAAAPVPDVPYDEEIPTRFTLLGKPRIADWPALPVSDITEIVADAVSGAMYLLSSDALHSLEGFPVQFRRLDQLLQVKIVAGMRLTSRPGGGLLLADQHAVYMADDQLLNLVVLQLPLTLDTLVAIRSEDTGRRIWLASTRAAYTFFPANGNLERITSVEFAPSALHWSNDCGTTR